MAIHATDLSPSARQLKAGQWAFKLLRDTQELFARNLETRVILAELNDDGVIEVSDPIFLEALEFIENPRHQITGFIYRSGDANVYSIGVSTPDRFLGFLLVPTGVKTDHEQEPSAPHWTDKFKRWASERAARQEREIAYRLLDKK